MPVQRKNRRAIRPTATDRKQQLLDETGRRLEDEPVSQVRWLHRDLLRANDYNPNRVAPPELELLIISILEDGYTQPIVALDARSQPSGALPDHCDIVDGYHRWVTSDDPRLLARYHGMLPVVIIQADPVHRMLSTVRHNRARGIHAIVPMAEIVRSILADGVDPADLSRRLQMDGEEIERLSDKSGMPVKLGNAAFGPSWKPRRPHD